MGSKTHQDTSVNTKNSRWLMNLLAIGILLGIGFRFFEIDRKLYWHDEAYTSIRAAGFTRQEIDGELFQNRIVPAPELQKYQRIKPGSTEADTIRSLALEDPQHPPLYFLLARWWMQQFGSSLTASRSLPAILSLLSLPLMYALARELFASNLAALLATALLALSPFDILFAQTARQYSLLTATVIGSSWLLLRAVRLPGWQNWVFYSLAIALGFYTHPFFSLTLIGHGVFIIAYWLFVKKTKLRGHVTNSQFFLAVIGALILYIPWIYVLATNLERASSTTDWTRVSPGWLYLVKLWTLSFTALFFDFDFGFDNIWTYLLRLPFLLLIAAALYTICSRTSSSTWLFLVTSIFVPFSILALPDLILGGKRSAVSRYLISCFPGVQLAVAYLLASNVKTQQRFWQVILALVFTASIASCTVSAFSDTWWSKDLSYFNAEVAKIINKEAIANRSIKDTIVISDRGNDFTNMGDLLSLSYLLDKDVRLMLMSQSPEIEMLNKYSAPLVFRPSEKLRSALKQNQRRLEPILEYARLFRARRAS
ncbi:glycosyl transferase family 39 [Oscillatoria nigro-viridis PCC 7112]|uniref:Glycosyl transferase family 39 n=1 Tax=Phormidium nigroviride PCC 7112 TaxID=179408 RepID=K9VDH7_9CYAN|nr:glycosyltransferase family 39 protein [Oscillatoria nigro-viridis]AFZ05310.1 glycosyl transferase family 39 [Oscillatoria nigro-viridis PCC 7112]